MDDMTAFERRLSGEIAGLMGPVRPVDDLAIYESVTAAPRSHRWGFTMFSAVKLIAASVVVVLFGGFLMMGVLTTQQRDHVPAAGSVSSTAEATVQPTEAPKASVRTDILPGVALTVEGVEPGVFRVLNDGVRDLVLGGGADIVAGHDDGIWLLWQKRFFRLGSDSQHAWPDESAAYDGRVFEVAPDGTMWIIRARYPRIPGTRGGDALRSADGEVWVSQPCPRDCVGVMVAPDGKVWASWRDEGGTWRVGHLGSTGWEPIDGSIPDEFSPGGFSRLFSADSGDLYGVAEGWGSSLYRYHDGTWSRISDFGFGGVDVGRDGTVWQAGGATLFGEVSGSTDVEEQWQIPEPGGLASIEWATEVSRFGGALARFAGGEWNGWTPVDLPDVVWQERLETNEFGVAPDGSLWIAPWRDGLIRFDGATAEHFLPGRSVVMDVAADGSVWVLADGKEGKDLYVITPRP